MMGPINYENTAAPSAGTLHREALRGSGGQEPVTPLI